MTIRSTLAGLMLAWLALPLPAQEAGTVCPLSDDQTQKSIKAFAELVPLFQHPRCINCHGDVNPFDQVDSGHEGGTFPDENNPPDCSRKGCHEALPGWTTAPPDMSFVGLDQEKLCELMHRQFSYAQVKTGEKSFMGHLIDDNNSASWVKHPLFIETGLIGNRGLMPDEMVGGLEPPPGWNHPRLISVGQKWVDAMGGSFHGDEQCGCKKVEYVFRLNYTQTLNLNFGIINGQNKKTTGTADKPGVDIPLTAKEPNVFTGQGRLTVKNQGQFGTFVGGCSSQGTIAFDIKVTAKIEEGREQARGEDDKMHVTFECQRVQEQVSGQCPHQGGSSNNTGSCAADGAKLDFNPPTIGSSQKQDFPSPLPGSETYMTGTILKKE